MDTIFIWLIAGAAIGLLGIFLVASERELKSKRRELEELKHQLTDAPAPGIASASADVFSQEQGGASADLMARNKDLLEEVSSLSKKLEASESRLEQLETLRAHLNSKESEITELRWERERLQSELAAAKTRQASTELPTDEAMQNSPNDAEITALKEQLEASQAKIRDLESAQIQPAGTESGDKAFEELQRSLEVSTLQLQNALAAEQEKQKALEATQFQLVEMQQRYHELSAANLRLHEENSQHQQKLTNQNQLQVERLVILRQRLEQLRLKQAEVSEREGLIQEEILSMSQLLDGIPQTIHMLEPSNATRDDLDNGVEFKGRDTEDAVHTAIGDKTPFKAPAAELHTLYNEGSAKTNGFSAEAEHNQPANLTAAIAATQRTNELSPSEPKKKKRFGIFYAVIGVLVVGGGLAVGFLGKDSEQKTSAPRPKVEAGLAPSGFASADMKSRPTPAAPEHRDGRSVDRAALAVPDDSRIAKPAEKATTAVLSPGKPSSMAWESYEVIQPTRVFSAPRADSQLIANIEPGTEVNVVDRRDGWLEIRSKHGRPPGFIRQDTAIRIGSK
jgi:chromosome segregation ATPase